MDPTSAHDGLASVYRILTELGGVVGPWSPWAPGSAAGSPEAGIPISHSTFFSA